MKQTKLLPAIFFTLISGLAFSQPVSLKFKLENSDADTVRLTDKAGFEAAKSPSKNGLYIFSEKNLSGYFKLTTDKEFVNLYLEPGFDLVINADANDLDKTLKYENKGAAENNYLAAKTLLLIEEEKSQDPRTITDVNSFIQKIESGYHQKLKLLESSGISNAKFLSVEKKSLELEKLFTLLSNLNYLALVTKNKSAEAVRDSVINVIDMNDESALPIPIYCQLVLSKVAILVNSNKPTSAQIKNESFFEKNVGVIRSEIHSEKIRETVIFNLFEIFKYRMSYNDSDFTLIRNNIKDPRMIAKIDQAQSAMKSILPGSMSPDFKLTSSENKSYSLASFRGKFVYIDIWATWCGPCKAEIPHLKTLHEKFHDKKIEFVSICSMDTKETWQNFLDQNEMPGIQLFDDQNHNAFIQAYQVSAIPRFILLDPEGKIVDPNTSRPSDPATVSLLENLLSTQATK